MEGWVVRGSNTSLIVAGDGGGLRAVTSRYQVYDANASTSGNPGYKSWSGGSNGHDAVIGDDKLSGESDENRATFTSYFSPLFQNESSYKAFHMKMSLICMKMNL